MQIGAIGQTHAAEAMTRAAGMRPGGTFSGQGTLSPQEQQQLQKLRQTDAKVRAHEQAHLSAAAGLAMGGANLQYVRGPDGKQYAVGGEVSIDVSPAQSPEQTLDKARRIQAAALAPADPSAQDRAVAAAAAQMASEARMAMQRQETEEASAGGAPTRIGSTAPSRQESEAARAYTANQPTAPGSLFDAFA